MLNPKSTSERPTPKGFTDEPTVTQAGARPVVIPASKEAGLQCLLDLLVTSGAPGVVSLVADEGHLWHGACGYSDLEHEVPMKTSERFVIGSITKTFIATVVLQLVEESALKLDDSLERWLGQLVPDGSEITVRQLLNHTSGLFDYPQSDKFIQPYLDGDRSHTWTPLQLVALSTSEPPMFPAGTSFCYSNTNYILLGLLIEAVTGAGVAQQLEDRIFDPLGLRETEFQPLGPLRGRYAHGYLGPDCPYIDLPEGELTDVAALSPSFVRGWTDGAITSNADNVATFFQALLSGKLIGPEALQEMQTPIEIDRITGYGLGLVALDLPYGRVYGHAGDNPGYTAEVFVTKDAQRCALVFVNGDANSKLFKRRDVEQFLELALCD